MNKLHVAILFLIIAIIVVTQIITRNAKIAELAETVADGVQQVVELKTTAKMTSVEESTATENIETGTTKVQTARIETSEATTTTTTEATTSKKAKKQTTKKTTTSEPVAVNSEQGEHTTPLGRFKVTGYTAEEGFPEGSATASGVGCRPGICAMNNAQRKELGIQYGDSIFIEGLGTYQVQDCGCGYGVIDIWLYTNAAAYSITGYYDVYI